MGDLRQRGENINWSNFDSEITQAGHMQQHFHTVRSAHLRSLMCVCVSLSIEGILLYFYFIKVLHAYCSKTQVVLKLQRHMLSISLTVSFSAYLYFY